MRIRHLNGINSTPAGQQSDFSNVQTMLQVDSTKPDEKINTKENLVQSPRSIASPRQKESSVESGTAYPRAEYLDPLGIAKSEPPCPSPLALLAKTCQNIGQMMEIGSQLNRTPISCNTSSRNPPNSAFQAPNSKQNRPKVSTSGELKQGIALKRPIMTRLSESEAQGKSNSLSNGHAEHIVTNHHVQCAMKAELRNPVIATSKSSPPLFNSSPYSPTHKHPSNQCLEPMTTYTEQQPSSPTEHNTTSNALAQLARLSSSLLVPEPPRSVTSLLEGSAFKDRYGWSDTGRSQSGCKRLRRNSASRTQLVNNSSSNIPRKVSRDERRAGSEHAYPYHTPNHSPNDHRGFTNQHQPTTQDSTNMDAWSSMFQLLQHLLHQNEERSRLGLQETFSYQMARSFLDFFYGKLSQRQQHPPSFSQPLTVTEAMPGYSTIPSAMNSNLFPPDYLSSTCLKSAPMESANNQRCFLCGFTCSSRNELCIHVYSHFTGAEPEPRSFQSIFDRFNLWNPPCDASVHPSVNQQSAYKLPDFSGLHQINQYLATLLSRYGDQTSSDSTASSFFPTDSSRSYQTEQIQKDPSKTIDKDAQFYWMKLIQAYCQSNLNGKTQGLNTDFPVTSSQHTAFIFPTINSASPSMTLFPKV